MIVKKILIVLLGLASLCFLISCDEAGYRQRKIDQAYQEIFLNVDLNNISSDIALPSLIRGVNITYTSDNPSTFRIEGEIGKVNRGVDDKEITLTIDLSYETLMDTKYRTLVVKKMEAITKIETVMATLLSDINKQAITSNIELPTLVDDVVISYSSSNENVLSNEGIITPIEYDVEVKLTATLTYMDISDEVVFDLVVLGGNTDFNEIFANLFSGIDLTNLTSDLEFPSAIGMYTLSYISSNTSVLSNDGVITRGSEDIAVNLKVTITFEDDFKVFNVNVVVLAKGEYNPNPNHSNMELLQDKLAEPNSYGVGLPSYSDNGDLSLNILVIPVEISGYTFTNTDLTRLDKAFFGTSVETGFESVQSYYQKSSFGKVSINGTVTNKYVTGKTKTYYESQYNSGKDPEYEIMTGALSNFDSQLDYSLYDNNNDEFIDGIYLIYSAPVTYEPNIDDLWWAWCYQYYPKSNYPKYDSVSPSYYVWAGIDFIDENLTGNVSIPVNATTYIHESGHMFGLDDYYDYDDLIGTNEGGLGEADMMDYNFGDHNSFSKLMLGWVVPHIVTKTETISIKPAESSGQVLLVPAGAWLNTNSSGYFSEYLLIDFYTPTGLNELFAGKGQFSIAGVRIYHISARLGDNNGPVYSSLHLYDNSDSNIKLITFVEADNNGSITSTTRIKNSDLFVAGDSLLGTSHQWYDTYDGSRYLPFDIIIKSIDDEAVVEITFKS